MYFEQRIEKIQASLDQTLQIVDELKTIIKNLQPLTDDYLLQNEAMKVLKVKSPQLMKRLREEEGLPFYVLAGDFRYKRSEIDAWLRS